jgi:signal transduction histidine kinase
MSLVPSVQHRNAGFQSPWRDTLLVLGITVISLALSDHFNWSERLYALTRPEERLQLDELPIGMLVLLTGLIWLAWRRNQQARREIRARLAAEVELERALAANRELARETLRIQEDDRKHLAREIHDELGQYLNAIKLDAVFIRDASEAEGEASLDACRAIIRTVDHLHVVVRGMTAHLRPVALDELGLVAAIEHSVDEWRRRVPQTRFTLHVLGNFEDLEEAVSLTVYRLIQEGLTNAYKHAVATQVEIVLERRPPPIAEAEADGDVRLTVFDNGRGADPATRRTGHGLNGLRERVELAGGTFLVDSAPDQGFRLTARLRVGKS